MNKTDVLFTLQQRYIEAVRGNRKVIQKGAFVATIHPNTDLPWLNGWFCVDKPAPTHLGELIAEAASLDRQPFFELSDGLWPELPEILASHGLVERARYPLLTLTAEKYAPRPVSRARLAEADELANALLIQGLVFGNIDIENELEEATIEAAKLLESKKSLVGISCDGEDIVCAGQAVGDSEVREVCGLATLPDERKKGHCTEVIGALLNHFFADGGRIAWLSAGSPEAASVYLKAGFEPTSETVIYARPELGL